MKLLLPITLSLALVAGCAQLEKGANRVEYAASGTGPTATQPSPSDVAARAAAQAAAIASPQVAGIEALVGLLAASVGAVAGHLNGKRSGNAVVDEIANDVATLRDPNTPWTTKTQKTLESLGHVALATVPSDVAPVNKVA